MKNNTKTPAPCPACKSRLFRHNYPDLPEMAYWMCESCGRAYCDSAGTPGSPLPLSLLQTAGIVAIAQRHPDLFGFKKVYNDMGKTSILAVSHLQQAVEEGFLEIDKSNGNFIATAKGKVVTDRNARTCPTCSGIVLLHEPDHLPPFWKCISCETTIADQNGEPATPCACTKCGGVAVTRFTLAQNPGHYFWGCGSCRRIFEDVNGKMGRCSDDINE